MRHSIFGATAVAVVLFTSACGDNGPPVVTLGGDEFSYDPEIPTVAAGTIELRLENRGAQAHNLVFDEGTGLSAAGLADFIGPGGKVSYTLEVTPGTYGFFCSVAGHEAAGMIGTLIVE